MSPETTAQPPTPAPIDGLPPERRRWAVAAIFTALAMASLDTAIANVALPAIAAALHVGPADVIWVVNVYQIAMVATLLPLAALGEIVGHHRIYLGGLLLFTLACLAARVRGRAEPAGCPRAAGPRRQRHDEREYGAGALRLPRAACSAAASDTTRWWSRPPSRSARRSRRAFWRWAVALAVCDQHSVRPCRDLRSA